MNRGEDTEHALEMAVMNWLPARMDKLNAAALATLAVRLEREHADVWLRDVLAAPPSEGFARLAEAVRANQEDETERAAESARQAAAVLRGHPAAAYADAQLVYALRYQDRSAECADRAEAGAQRAARNGHAWLLGHFQLELGICMGKLLDSGDAYRAIRQSIETARRANYPVLELRAEGILSGVQTVEGNLLGAWESARLSLARYWSGAYPSLRAHQLYVNLRRTAERMDLPHAARAFAHAQVLAVAETSHRRLEALGRAELSALAARTGDAAEARREGDAAELLFARLRQSQTAEDNRLFAEIHGWQSAIADGRWGEASAALLAMRDAAAKSPSVAVQLRYHQAAGEAFQHEGRHREAEESFRAVLHLTAKKRATLRTSEDRAAATEAAAKAYRGLAQIHLTLHNDAVAALHLWEQRLGGQPPDLHHLRRETVLTFADLPNGLVVWVFDNRGLQWRRLVAPRQELEGTAQRFVRACADPQSNVAALHNDARQLYEWLIAPLAQQLDPARTLVVESDGAIARIPLQALLDEQQIPLGERFAIVAASGASDYLKRSAAPPLAGITNALIVANPSLGRETRRAFPPLPQTLKEREIVAARFANATVLEGRGATLQALMDAMPAAQLLHFAGHGFSNSGNGGLLLAPDNAELEVDTLDWRRMAGRNWSNCRLAVLSACSSGTGEARGPVNPESLVRWLLWAGVARVVASRWNADASTSAGLMEHFYSAALAGADTAAALQLAQRRIRARDESRHPYFWAGFQAFGGR